MTVQVRSMTDHRLKELLLYFARHYPAHTQEEKRMKIEALRYCGHKRENKPRIINGLTGEKIL